MKKLILTLTLTLALLLALSACSNKIIEVRDPTDSESASLDSESESVSDTTDDASESTATDADPEAINPLTGLACKSELVSRRPVAVMINNIEAAMPQVGTSFADVIYECIVEGAQTRLMALYLDYEDVGVIGSVRSSREYYLDFAANHDAIYVHAGGSNEAYKQIKARRVDNLDGVNMYVPGMFYRDEERLKTHAYEHTLMTTGEKIKDGIEFKGYRTEYADGFVSPFSFGEAKKCESGSPAAYVSVSYSPAHEPFYNYNEEKTLYERGQFGKAQTDSANGETLAFKNIVMLFCPTFNTLDEYGHYNVNDIGSGDGYYFTNGKYIEITWKKEKSSSPVELYDKDGDKLIMNPGKTMMQICTNDMKDQTVISAEKQS